MRADVGIGPYAEVSGPWRIPQMRTDEWEIRKWEIRTVP